MGAPVIDSFASHELGFETRREVQSNFSLRSPTYRYGGEHFDLDVASDHRMIVQYRYLSLIDAVGFDGALDIVGWISVVAKAQILVVRMMQAVSMVVLMVSRHRILWWS